MITADDALRLFSYNRETGKLSWKLNVGKVKTGDEAGYASGDGYRRVRPKGKMYLVHRVVWLMEKGAWPSFEIDHLNSSRSDNRFQNLRDVPASVNAQNKHRPAKHNSSGFMGVVRSGDKWVASLVSNQKRTYLGSFPSPQLAHEVYLTTKRTQHTGCMI